MYAIRSYYGTIVGITRGANKGHFARAALEGIAFQVMDVLKSMEADAGIKILELRVDGGASANNLLMQFHRITSYNVCYTKLLRIGQIRFDRNRF